MIMQSFWLSSLLWGFIIVFVLWSFVTSWSQRLRNGQDDVYSKTRSNSHQSGPYYFYEPYWTSSKFKGKGPAGYQRPDARIEEYICDRLFEHNEIDASDVTVKVHNGEVILTGTVNDRFQKRLVEIVADSVAGVKDVVNNIRLTGNSKSADQHDSVNITAPV